MAKRYQQNQWNKVKEHFREHPYYKLCKTVFDEFQKLCPTMVMTPEQLFVDASLTLDSILQTGDKSAEQCHSLWTEKYNQYREQDQMKGRPEDTKAEVAMLFYVVMYGVSIVNHSHYRGTLQRTLHKCIHDFYGNENCRNIEQKLHEPVNQHTAEMMEWMEEYFNSKESLTNEIDDVLADEDGEDSGSGTGIKGGKPGAKAKSFRNFIINQDEADKVIDIIRQNILKDNAQQAALLIVGAIEAEKVSAKVTAPSISREFGVNENSIKPHHTKYRNSKNSKQPYFEDSELKSYIALFSNLK